MREDEKVNKRGRLFSAALSFFLFLMLSLSLRIPLRDALTPPCLFHAMTGLYCPGCGGTRSFYCFCKGQLLQSLLTHPAVPYMAWLVWMYGFSYLPDWISKGRLPQLRPAAWHWYILIALVFLHFILRNILLLIWGIEI